MTLKQFIKDNRAEIDSAIQRVVGPEFRRNDNERRLWVMNDEGLYRWARRSGCRI